MRKRIVIAVLATVGVGVLVFVVSQPKKGSVEWHKRKYVAVLEDQPLSVRARNAWNWLRGNEERYYISPFEDGEVRRQGLIRKHQQALINLGFLERREFVLSNRSTREVIYEGGSLLTAYQRRARFEEEFLDVDTRGTNVLIIVAARADMPVVAEIISKADVPQEVQ